MSGISKVNRGEFKEFALDHLEHFDAIPCAFEDSNGVELNTKECWELAESLGLIPLIKEGAL